MTYETILVETDARGTKGVTLITINRPQALNALNSQVLAELIAAFAAYQADASQLCAILTGSGDKAFAAGADIKEMADKPAADFYLDDFFAPWTSEIVRPARDQARRCPRHGRLAAADPRDRQVEVDGNVPHRPDDGRRGGRAQQPCRLRGAA